MKNIIITALLLVLIPTTIFGYEAVLRQSALESTYTSRIEAIDARVEVLNESYSLIVSEYSSLYYAEMYGRNAELIEIQSELAQLKDEKRILEVSYQLINDSFNYEYSN